MPATGTPSAMASPRAAREADTHAGEAAGPTVTAIIDSARRSTPACCSSAAMAGSKVAAWPRPSSRCIARLGRRAPGRR
jgi:hypothetical protein